MPTLSEPSSSTPVKLLLMGDSGTGKTGSLISLVKAGYQLRILDADNKLVTGILPHLVRDQCPDKMKNIQYEVVRNKWKASDQGPTLGGVAPAFAKMVKLLDKWSDGSRPSDWGLDTICVVDSLSFVADAAFEYAQSMNPGAKEPRQWFYSAQQLVENLLAMLTAESFATHLIVITHVVWVERPDGLRGYPNSIGKALAPTLPSYFDNVLLTKTSGYGEKARREILTVPEAMVDLKTPVKIGARLSIDTGLNEFFRAARGQK